MPFYVDRLVLQGQMVCYQHRSQIVGTKFRINIEHQGLEFEKTYVDHNIGFYYTPM